MKYDIHHLPSPGFLTYKLTKDEMDFMWNRINEVKDHKQVNDKLAGNISKSYDMGLHNLKIINNIIFTLANEYERQFGTPYEEQVSGTATHHLVLRDWWVNYQYQNEFNPMHSHSGIYSWVIWMKIPTEFEDQAKLPIASQSNSKDKISNFNFIYTNSIGTVTDYKIEMSKAREGTLCFFPARLKHSVYPFFNCDEARISIAGNISRYSRPNEEVNEEK